MIIPGQPRQGRWFGNYGVGRFVPRIHAALFKLGKRMPEPLRILNVAYALTQVTPDACGGTEQVLTTLLGEFARPAYHWLEATTVAAAGSRVPGRLVSTNCGYWSHPLREEIVVHDAAQALFGDRHNAAAWGELNRRAYDLIHNQGGTWYRRAADTRLPVLLTLHLPLAQYPSGFLDALPENVYLQCVSRSQLAHYAAYPRCLGYIGNGVDLEWFTPREREGGGYFLFLGRICPEKAPHWAIAAACRLRRRLVLAGRLHPFPAHVAYFRREIAPALGGDVSWLPAPSAFERRELLRRCQAVLLPSQAEETSSLVAMEAAACGRPVVATRRGALPEIVRHGETGLLAATLDEFCRAAARAAGLDSAACRRAAEQAFDARRMAAEYAALYRRLAGGDGWGVAPGIARDSN